MVPDNLAPQNERNASIFNSGGELTPQAGDACLTRLDQHLDRKHTPRNAPHMCRRCRTLELGKLLTRESKIKAIGFLDSFDDPNCQLCDTIRHFAQLHWGSQQQPTDVNDRRPVVRMQSRKWYSIYDKVPTVKTVHRIALVLDRPPSNSSIQAMGRALKDEWTFKYILTELEVDPTRVGNAHAFPSLRRSIPPCVDLDLVQSWFKECRDHERCNFGPKFRQSNLELFAHGFRLIDVVEGRLVEKTDPCAYVALSYVWGQLESLRTNRQNLSALYEPSSLDPHGGHQSASRIPRTIVDTITLCRSIGQRYLWIDSLCIIQDNLDEKLRLINSMDCIYENAILTVVALSGSDAGAGLAGIRPRSSIADNDGRQYIFHEVDGTQSIGIGRISLDEQIRSSKWNTRGWTYQERLLSPRKLYFTPHEVFYECKCHHLRHERREGYGFEKSSDFTVMFGAPMWAGYNRYTTEGYENTVALEWAPWLSTAPQEIFQEIVSIYSRKQLTDPGDVLNALAGIYQRLYASADVHGFGILSALQGNPLRIFSKLLLWSRTKYHLRMRNVEILDIGMNALQGIPMQGFCEFLLWFTTSRRHKPRRKAAGFSPSTWSWTSQIAPIDFATATYGAPFSNSGAFVNFLSVEGAWCLIKEWCISFENGNAVDRVRFSGNVRSYRRADPNRRRIHISPFEQLELVSPSSGHDRFADSSSVTPGVLEFLGPYIPFPTDKSVRWVKMHGGEWHLKFAADLFVIVRLDSEEYTVEGFVLLACCLGLCVKKAGEYFERVGMAMFTPMKVDWKIFLRRGFLDIYWKRISLR